MSQILFWQKLGKMVHISDIGNPENVGSDNITIDDLEPDEDETNIEDVVIDIRDNEDAGDDDDPLGTQ